MSGTLAGQVATEVQKLATGALVHLYTLDTTQIGGDLILRWTPSVIYEPPAAPTRLSFQGIEYEPYPIMAEGFEWRGKGPAPRPRISIGNIDNIAGSLVVGYGDLVGAQVTRLRTFAQFLDGMPGADPGSYYEPDIWRIERKTTHNQQSLEFELSNVSDQQGRRLPGRQVFRDVCTHVYRQWNAAAGTFDYTGVTCPYTGGASWTQDGLVTDGTRDACGFRLSDCRLRFPAGALPSRAFPGMARAR